MFYTRTACFISIGTRAENFGKKTGGFDVYTSTDLIEFSAPIECFNSVKSGLNLDVNWAPEVHKINHTYYMFATFTKPDGLRGTYILSSQLPTGPFQRHSNGAVTPERWQCLDGTFYEEAGEYYLVFCHEHVQITDGTICYQKLSKDLTHCGGEVITLFASSD